MSASSFPLLISALFSVSEAELPQPDTPTPPCCCWTDRQADLPGQWHNVCHPSPPSCTSLLHAGAEGRQGGLTSSLYLPQGSHLHTVLRATRGGSPKASPPSPLTHTGGDRSLPPPRSLHPQEGLQQIPRRGTGDDGEAEAAAGRGARQWAARTALTMAISPARRVQKVQSKVVLVPASPHMHRAPKSEKPGLPRGFAWKRVVLFIRRGCWSLLHSRACARDFEVVRVRCGTGDIVMDRP